MKYVLGLTGGLQLVLIPGLQEYPENMVMNNFLSKGVVIFVDYDFEPMPTDPVFAQPGSDIYISLTATKQTFSPPAVPIFNMPCRKNTTLQFVNGKLSSMF